MANDYIFYTAFDYSTAELPKEFSSAGASITVGSYGRLSGNGIQCAVESTGATITLQVSFAPVAIVNFGFALDLYSGLPLSGSRTLGTLRDGANMHLIFLLLASGAIEVRRQAYNGTLLATTSPIATSGYPHLEFRVVISDTVGEIQAWVNGDKSNPSLNRILNLTGLDTRNAGNATVDSWTFFQDPSSVYTSPKCRLSDFFIAGGTQKGDRHFIALNPNANGDNSDFTGSDFNSIDNYALVSKSTPNVSTYIAANAAAQRDLHNVGALGLSDAEIDVVGVRTYDQKSEVGTCTFSHSIKSGGVISDSAVISPGTVPTFHTSSYYVDPNTGVAFTPANIDALQMGAIRQS
jgi:hypothetical protein